jgi:hypothetical protein
MKKSEIKMRYKGWSVECRVVHLKYIIYVEQKVLYLWKKDGIQQNTHSDRW